MDKKLTTLVIGLALLISGMFIIFTTQNLIGHAMTCIGGFVFGWGLAIKQ